MRAYNRRWHSRLLPFLGHKLNELSYMVADAWLARQLLPHPIMSLGRCAAVQLPHTTRLLARDKVAAA